MNIEFRDGDLERLAFDARFTGGFSRDIVKAYRRRIQQIQAAPSERDFYALKSLHYEKLKGKRDGERSMRLNAQYRLILYIEGHEASRTVVVLSIEDYH